MIDTNHILLCRSPERGGRYFCRYDWHIQDAVGVWQQSSQPLPLRGIVDGAIRATENAKTPLNLTFSSYRMLGVKEIDSTISSGPPEFITISGKSKKTLCICPLGYPHGHRLCGVLAYFGIGQPPASGETFVHKGVGDRLKAYFDDLHERMTDSDQAVNEELLLRHNWEAEKLAPGLFAMPGWRRKQVEREQAAQAAQEAQDGQTGQSAGTDTEDRANAAQGAGIQFLDNEWIVTDASGELIGRFKSARTASAAFRTAMSEET